MKSKFIYSERNVNLCKYYYEYTIEKHCWIAINSAIPGAIYDGWIVGIVYPFKRGIILDDKGNYLGYKFSYIKTY